jgi:hypothetical protein
MTVETRKLLKMMGGEKGLLRMTDKQKKTTPPSR